MSTKTFNIKGHSVTVFWSEDPASGAKKRVYFSTDGKYALAIYADSDGTISRNTGDDRRRLGNLEVKSQSLNADMKKNLCWPIAYGKTQKGELAFIMPCIPQNFFCSFLKNNNKRTEKVIREFSDPFFANAFFSIYPQGASFYNHLVLCREIAHAVQGLHKIGVIHSDLSENNVLIDPFNNKIYIIDIDGSALNSGNLKLVDVSTLGTPKYIAPEIIQNVYQRKEIAFDAASDLFPLAVHMYLLLLHRHPLNRPLSEAEKNKYDIANVGEDNVVFGLLPAYIEEEKTRKYIEKNSTLYRNRYINSYRMATKKHKIPEKDLNSPNWLDLDNFSALRICGPYLAELFTRAFVDGIDRPSARPSAKEWERAITKTMSLLYPCTCRHKAFVLSDRVNIHCPFCGKKVNDAIPVLYVYFFSHSRQCFINDKNTYKEHIIVGYANRKIYQWQLLGDVINIAEKGNPLFAIVQERGQYNICNINLPEMQVVYEQSNKKNEFVDVGHMYRLTDGMMFKLMTNGDLEIILINRFIK